MKNECLKMRDENHPYEVWKNEEAGWEWRVLKKWQSPDKEKNNPYARWFCMVFSPFCPNGEMGDVYVSEIKSNAVKVS